jgi:hypothetical protein
LNSTWNTNIALFEKRFPALKEILCEDIAFFEKETEEGRSPLPLEFLAAKNGSPTALYKADVAGGDASGTNASGGDATETNASGTNATAGTGTNGDASGGNAAGADATGSDVSGGDAAGGKATRTNASGGNATGTNASGGDATWTNATAGTGTNGDATGGNAAVGDASGADDPGSDVSGTDAAGGKATRTNATAGTGTNGDASGGNAAKTDESGANAAKSAPSKQPPIPLHSKYNPEREAEQLVKEFSKNDFDAAVFLGFGLGYAPIAFAEKNPSTPLILIENNPLFLFAALNTLDFTKVFSHPNLIFVTKTNASTAVSVLANYKAERIKIYSSKAHTAHDPSFANEFLELFKRSLQKDEINTNTLEKFSRLWMKNSMANLPYLAKCDGVRKYRSALLQLGGKATELPFVILAAGPSLETVLPHLSKLKESCVLVCVDTALHALVKAGVEPDFIVLVDPQYACARHLEFLKAKSSVLITESAAYPSVFRFECRETVMCSSLFPIGQYFESQLGQKGKLGAGGSVATTAWDFARTCGTRKIYIAGMDLGFPGKQTHIRGSQFEERAHRSSSRTHTAESDGIASLLGASPSLSKDYRGNSILTDKRMSLFAWWFESNCSTALKDGQTTFTLTPQSLAIPNISISSPQELLLECNAKKEELMEAKKKFFEQAQKNSIQIKAQEEKNALPSFENVLEEFKENLLNLLSLSKKGLALCQSAIQNRTKVREVNAKLSEIDSQILNSKGKDAAALVFPTERQLAAKAKELPDSAMNDPMLKPIYYSRLIYSELQKAVKAYLDLT